MELFWNKKTYQLKKKTMDVSDRMDDIIDMSQKTDKETKRKAFKAEYDFITDILGADAAKEALDCTSIKDVDVEVMITLFNSIGYAWKKVSRDFENMQLEEAMDTPVINKTVDLANAVDNIKDLT